MHVHKSITFEVKMGVNKGEKISFKMDVNMSTWLLEQMLA